MIKATRGRKPIKKEEKKHKIVVFVKAKKYAKALSEINKIVETSNN